MDELIKRNIYLTIALFLIVIVMGWSGYYVYTVDKQVSNAVDKCNEYWRYQIVAKPSMFYPNAQNNTNFIVPN